MHRYRPQARLGPYIGITGFTARQQIQQVLDAAPVTLDALLPGGHPGRYLMAGVLVSDKSLAGAPLKRPLRHPDPDQVQQIFHPHCFNVVHYHSERSDADLLAVAQRCGLQPGQGMQLNICWPDPGGLERLRAAGIRTILQLGPKAMAQLSDQELDRRLRQYRWPDFLLLDLSGGTGRPLQSQRSLELLELIARAAPAAGLAIAGGLGPGCGPRLQPLLQGHVHATARRYYLSLDAESGVRDDQDRLDLGKCAQYLDEAWGAVVAPHQAA